MSSHVSGGMALQAGQYDNASPEQLQVHRPVAGGADYTEVTSFSWQQVEWRDPRRLNERTQGEFEYSECCDWRIIVTCNKLKSKVEVMNDYNFNYVNDKMDGMNDYN